MDIELSYGAETRTISIPDENIARVVEPRAPKQILSPQEAFKNALDNPIGAPIEELCAGKRVCFFVEDHTRSEPHAEIIKSLCSRLIAASFVRFFITTGSHNPGATGIKEITNSIIQSAQDLNYEIHINDAKNNPFKEIGTTSHNTKVLFNEKALDCDLYVVGANMTNHYFAGYANAVKNFLPGACAFETIEQNHKLALKENATFGRHPLHPDTSRRTNPVAEDMVEAMNLIRQGKPAFTLAFIYSHGDILWSAAGDLEKVTARGMAKVDELTSFKVAPSSYVVTSTGGHPTDDTLYMAQKGIQPVSSAIAPNAKVLWLAKCAGGQNGLSPNEAGIKYFYEQLAKPKDEILKDIEADFHLPMQKPYKMAQILQKVRELWLYTELSQETLEKVHMKKAEDPQKLINSWIEEDPSAKILVFKNAGKLAIYAEEEKITARGHANVLGTHETTIEITKEAELTPQGDCIIGVSANKACADLSEEVKSELKKDREVTITLKVGDLIEEIHARGSPDLILTHPHDIVIRKSDFIDDRTLCINADKACKDLSREFIEALKNPEAKLSLGIIGSSPQ